MKRHGRDSKEKKRFSLRKKFTSKQCTSKANMNAGNDREKLNINRNFHICEPYKIPDKERDKKNQTKTPPFLKHILK